MVGRMVWSLQAQRGMAAAIEAFRPDVAHLHNVYHQLSPSILERAAPRRRARRADPARLQARLPDLPAARPGRGLHGLRRREVLERAGQALPQDGSLLASATMAVDLTVHTLLRSYRHVDALHLPEPLPGRPDGAGPRLPGPDARHPPLHRPRRRPAQAGARAATRSSPDASRPRRGSTSPIRAIAHLPEPAHLDIAGDGPARAELEALAAAQAPGRVTFHGRLPKDQLFDLLRASSVALVPSTWYENQPMAVLEGFAIGLPVVGVRPRRRPRAGRRGSATGCSCRPTTTRRSPRPSVTCSRIRRGAFAMGQNGRRKIEDGLPTLVAPGTNPAGSIAEIGVRGA